MLRYPSFWKCPNCRRIVKEDTVCSNCGFSYPRGFPKEWKCFYCGHSVKNNNYCKKCFYPRILKYPKLWHCPKCLNLNFQKLSCNCGYSARGIRAKQAMGDIDVHTKKVIKKQKHNIKLVGLALIVPLLILGFLILSSVVMAQRQEFLNYSYNNVFFLYPKWTSLNKSNVILRLYDSRTNQELIYLNSKKVFDNLDNEKNRILSNIQKGYGGEVNIYDEFGMKGWTVCCYTIGDKADGCLATRYCQGNVSYIYITSFEQSVNTDIFKGILDSFICT